MKRLLLLFLFMSIPAHAAPRWVTAVPRAMGRNVKVMAMPWTDKRQALRDYLQIAAIVADGYTSHTALNRCPSCSERSPLMPRRPSMGVYWGEMIVPLALVETTYSSYINELTKDDSNWAFRDVAPWIVPATDIAAHTANSISNSRIPPSR